MMSKNYTLTALALAKHNNYPYYILITDYYKCKTRKDYFAHYIKYIMKNDLFSIIRTYMKVYKLKKEESNYKG